MNTINLNSVFPGTQNSGDYTVYRDSYPYINLVEHYYPTYYRYWKDESNIEKAFRLVQKLMEKKLVKEPKTVKDFIELVNSISEIL